MKAINNKLKNENNYASYLNKNFNIISINKPSIKQKLEPDKKSEQLLKKSENKRYIDTYISFNKDSEKNLSLKNLTYEIPSKWNNTSFKAIKYEKQNTQPTYNINKSNNTSSLKPISETLSFNIDLIDITFKNIKTYNSNNYSNYNKEDKKRTVSVNVNNNKKNTYFLQKYNNKKDKNEYNINNKVSKYT